MGFQDEIKFTISANWKAVFVIFHKCFCHFSQGKEKQIWDVTVKNWNLKHFD